MEKTTVESFEKHILLRILIWIVVHRPVAFRTLRILISLKTPYVIPVETENWETIAFAPMPSVVISKTNIVADRVLLVKRIVFVIFNSTHTSWISIKSLFIQFIVFLWCIEILTQRNVIKVGRFNQRSVKHIDKRNSQQRANSTR